jgi:ABC-type nitrate/sulfonate/bicarbonate transport system substrate-binding protein
MEQQMKFPATGTVLGISLAVLTALPMAGTVRAADLIKITVPALTFPTVVNTANDIIKAKNLDKANGLDTEIVSYGTVGAQYAGIAKGETQSGFLPPYQVAKMRLEGVQMAIYGTMVGMSDTHIVTRNPDIRQFTDLKGRTLAATVGFSSYQYLEIYTKRLGLKLGTDIKIVNASTSLAQAHLQADRVDAALVWEPSTTRILMQIPDARVIMTGDEAWKLVTGDIGWDIITWVNMDWVKAHAGGLARLLKMYKDYGDFVNANPDEADAIITSGQYTSKGIPPATIASAVRGKRLFIDVKPAWDPEPNKQIWQMLELGVREGYVASQPDRGVVVNDRPN